MTKPPVYNSPNVLSNTSKLRAQIEAMKRASPTARQITLTLTAPVYQAMKTIGEQSGESPAAVASNVLSGWVAECQAAFDAEQQAPDKSCDKT